MIQQILEVPGLGVESKGGGETRERMQFKYEP